MKDFFVKLTSFTDERGRLTPVSTRGTDLPFEVGRVFWITDEISCGKVARQPSGRFHLVQEGPDSWGHSG